MKDKIYKILGTQGITTRKKKIVNIALLVAILIYGVSIGIYYKNIVDSIITIISLYAIYSYGNNPIYSITAYLIGQVIMMITDKNSVGSQIMSGLAILVIYLIALYSNKKQLDKHNKPIIFKKWHNILIYTNIYIFIAIIANSDTVVNIGNSQSSRLLVAAFVGIPAIRTIAIVLYSNIFYVLTYVEMLLSVYVLYIQYNTVGLNALSVINVLMGIIILLYSTVRFYDRTVEDV